MTGSIITTVTVIVFAFGLYTYTGMARRITPFMSVIILADVIIAFSLVGMLYGGTIAAFLLAWLVFALALYKNKAGIKQKFEAFCSPGVLLFALSCVVVLIALYSTKPVFHDWDEFSFWGTARKILNKFDAIYTYHNTSMLGQSIPPSMTVLTYFFGFFNPEFTEWVCYYAYDLLFMACFGAFTAVSDKKQNHTATMIFITAVTIPFIFDVTAISSKLSSAYISSYGDMPLALVFAAGIAVYMAGGRNTAADIIPVLPVLFFLTLIKDMGFALSCIIVFIIFFDMVVSKKDFSFFGLKGFFAKCGGAAAMLAVTAASYIGWSVHISNVLNINRSEFSETATVSMAGMLISGVKELISPVKSRKFGAIYSSMISAFFNTKVSVFGRGIKVFAVITVVFALAVILAPKKDKIRAGLMYLTSLTGFVGYYVFHLFLYVYVFKDDAYTLPSYERYVNIYYAGWLILGVICLGLIAKNSAKLIRQLAVYGMGAACVFMVAFYTESGNLFLSAESDVFAKRQIVHKKAEYLEDVIGPDDVIYIFSEGNAGENWFVYSYELLDNYVVKDNGLFGRYTEPEKDREIIKEISRYMKKNGATHILVDNIDSVTHRRYKDLFDRSIEEIAFERVGYYKINYTDSGFNFQLVKWGRTG